MSNLAVYKRECGDGNNTYFNGTYIGNVFMTIRYWRVECCSWGCWFYLYKQFALSSHNRINALILFWKFITFAITNLLKSIMKQKSLFPLSFIVEIGVIRVLYWIKVLLWVPNLMLTWDCLNKMKFLYWRTKLSKMNYE